MIKLEKTEVWGWEHAIRGMRNPMNSWDKSDSTVKNGGVSLGDNDLDLMQRLIQSGAEHRKFLRQVFVSVDITAPLYWWKEFDTYKVGTVANSCSTMHKIHAKKFAPDDFSCEHLLDFDSAGQGDIATMSTLACVILALNSCRKKYLETKDKKYWWQMIQLLPTSYNQKRTVTISYENLLAMYHQRKNHKLDEWRELCSWVMSLPYAEALIGEGENHATTKK